MRTAVGLAALMVATAACGGSDEPDDGGRAATLALLAMECEQSPADIGTTEGEPGAWDASRRGEVAGCAYDRRVEPDEMRTSLAAGNFGDPGLSTAAHKLRVSYWTERGPGEPVLTTAAVYIPQTRRGDPSPLLVLGHGSVGVANHCAPSLEDPRGFKKDWQALAYTYAGDGWVSIMPDFPGLGSPGVGSWMLSPDEGHSMLDATRAARKLFNPGVISDKNALIGHSNGGHAALSAHAYAADYGHDGDIELVLIHSPFWLSNAAWGALISPAGVALLTPTFMSLTMQYFYGHLDALEGPEHQLDAFLPDKAAEAKAMLDGGCWQDVTGTEMGPPSIGVSQGSDLFTQTFIDEVGACGLSDQCETPLAQTWRARWVADRPPPDTTIPIVHWMGQNDDFLTPGFQQCGYERLQAQGAQQTLCVSADSAHSDIIINTADWVHQELARALLGEEGPAACPGVELFDEALSCELPITNSTDPSDP